MSISERLEANKVQSVANRSINRKFQQVTLRDATVDFKALELAINTDGSWEDMEAVYQANFDSSRAISTSNVIC